MKKLIRFSGIAVSLSMITLIIGACAPGDQSGAGGVFKLVEVAPDVWATVVRDGISPSQYAASLIVVRTTDVVVVDTRHDYPSADALIETIRGLTDLPVRYVVNTHWHGDHVHGNARFRDWFPDVKFLSGSTTNADIASLGRQRLDEEIERVTDRVASAIEMLDSGLGDDGSPLTDEEITALPGQIAAAEEYLEARKAIELIPPGMTTDGEITLDDADPVVRIVKVGPAHTRGDVVVFVPDRGVLALGDLIEDGFPWLGDGYPLGWVSALQRSARLGATTFLGAHGPVLRDGEMLDTQYEFARRIVAATRTGVEAGMTLDEIVVEADFSDFQKHFTRHLTGASESERAQRFETFVTETLARAYAQATGELAEADG